MFHSYLALGLEFPQHWTPGCQSHRSVYGQPTHTSLLQGVRHPSWPGRPASIFSPDLIPTFPSLTVRESCPKILRDASMSQDWGPPEPGLGPTVSSSLWAPRPIPSWMGQAALSQQMSRRIRGLFGAMNFWAIITYNLVSLNSLEFTELVTRRLLLTGEGQGCGDTRCACPHPPQHHRASAGRASQVGRDAGRGRGVVTE